MNEARDLKALGVVMREELAATAVTRAVKDALPGVLSGASPRRRVRPTTRAYALATTAFALVVGLVGWRAVARSAEPVAGAQSVQTAPAAPLTPPAAITLTSSSRDAIHFSDDSHVVIGPNAQVTTTSLDARGGRVKLASGEIDASFHHREGTRWIVEAGRVEVEVTGTQFKVAWEPASEHFRIAMREGSVVLRGCSLDGRVARTGDVVEVDCAAPHAVTPSSPIAPVRVPVKRAPIAATTTCENAAVDEVSRLADAARHARALPEARACLLALRRRFPATPAAARATFDLGVVSFDGGSPADAAKWFERYLAEQPDGPLAREALGRLAEARDASDDPRARDAARAYVDRFPTGPHVGIARKILAKTE